MSLEGIKRAWLDSLLDRLRFRLDTLPSMDYQPLPWLGLPKARRGSGVQSRWNAISGTILELDVNSGLDIGCNAGFFCISLAQIGINVVGIENSPKYFRIFHYAIRKLKLENVGVLFWKVTPNTVHMLPSGDCILFLSVWHHLVKEFGFDSATELLRQLWLKADKVLFFETGEAEMPETFKLPEMLPDSTTYLQNYLKENCVGGEVRHLGLHDAFSPDRRSVKRNLFAIIRAKNRQK